MADNSSNVGSASLAYRWALVIAFLGAIFLPLIAWQWALDPSPDLAENRAPAPAPAWPRNRAAWQQLPKAIEAYWNDAFGFRRTLIRLQAGAQFELGVSPTPRVVIGKAPWLFYAGDESMEQRQGLRPFSDTELEA